MPISTEADEHGGATRLVSPAEGEDYWQPEPANGHISVRVAPGLVAMENPLALGTQTLPPGGFVREHAHDQHEEVLHFISGSGTAVIEGVEHPLAPGVTIFVGKNRRHKFINTGTDALHWLWLIVPNGLEDFFKAIGRPRVEGGEDPTPFPRPADAIEIERRTVFAPGSEKV